MKNLKKIQFSLLFVMVSILFSCSNDEKPSIPIDSTSVISTVQIGTWRVTYYQDSGVDETSNFTGYNFTFGPLNALTASNGTNNYAGAWSVTNDDDSDDDNPSNDVDFNILFDSPANFFELSEDWNIIELTDAKIKLEHISGGDESTDYITFQKN